MPNFVQICTIVNELWAIDEIQNGGRRHLEFIIFVHFGQMIYFRWQPSTSLQNFIHLRQSAAELLMFVQKSKMAAKFRENMCIRKRVMKEILLVHPAYSKVYNVKISICCVFVVDLWFSIHLRTCCWAAFCTTNQIQIQKVELSV